MDRAIKESALLFIFPLFVCLMFFFTRIGDPASDFMRLIPLFLVAMLTFLARGLVAIGSDANLSGQTGKKLGYSVLFFFWLLIPLGISAGFFFVLLMAVSVAG